jgi:hypothetical protein
LIHVKQIDIYEIFPGQTAVVIILEFCFVSKTFKISGSKHRASKIFKSVPRLALLKRQLSPATTVLVIIKVWGQLIIKKFSKPLSSFVRNNNTVIFSLHPLKEESPSERQLQENTT